METIQIRFDPKILSFEELLKIFWSEHDYSRQSASRQYMNAIFYHSLEQKEMIEKSLKKLPGRVETEIASYESFYPAEDYHQKFYLQRYPEIKNEYMSFYAAFHAFVASTSAARVNGFLGGYGNRYHLERILPELGLSSKSGKLLLKKKSNVM